MGPISLARCEERLFEEAANLAELAEMLEHVMATVRLSDSQRRYVRAILGGIGEFGLATDALFTRSGGLT